jgi:hypothetical protein
MYEIQKDSSVHFAAAARASTDGQMIALIGIEPTFSVDGLGLYRARRSYR